MALNLQRRTLPHTTTRYHTPWPPPASPPVPSIAIMSLNHEATGASNQTVAVITVAPAPAALASAVSAPAVSTQSEDVASRRIEAANAASIHESAHIQRQGRSVSDASTVYGYSLPVLCLLFCLLCVVPLCQRYGVGSCCIHEGGGWLRQQRRQCSHQRRPAIGSDVVSGRHEGGR